MWAMRIAKYANNGINPLPYALDELPWDDSQLIDEVLIEISQFESDNLDKMFKDMKGK